MKAERRSGNKIIRVLDLKVSSTFFFSPAVKRGPILGFVLDPLVSLVLSIAQDVELAGGKGARVNKVLYSTTSVRTGYV